MKALDFWGAIAALVSLIGLIPILYNAGLQLNDRRKARHSRIIRGATRNAWHIIRPDYDQKMARVEDVMACQEVFAKLTSMGYKVTVGGDDPTDRRSRNLVLVCGPKANKVSARLVEDIDLPFELIDKSGVQAFRDNRTFQTYTSGIDEGHSTDIAVLGRVTDSAGNTCYLLWGLHGAGTIGAARAFTDDEFLDATFRIVKSRDFVGIIHFGYSSLDDIGAISWLALPTKLSGGD